jgi:hypothetical protein
MSSVTADRPEAVATDLQHEVSPSIGPAFELVLRERRHAYNFTWRQARDRFPHLSNDDAASFFVSDLAPLISALSNESATAVLPTVLPAALPAVLPAVRADRLESICDIAVDVGARASGLRLLGVNATQPWVTKLWRETFPLLARHIADNPLFVITELSHATAQFSAHAASRPQQWLRLLTSLGPQAADLEQLRLLGKVIAWRSGLAHYRSGALIAADELPTTLVERALEIPEGQSWSQWREALHESPWPTSLVGTELLLARVGWFRGLGGVFTEPPLLATRDGDLIARSGTDAWLVTADAFGSTLHRSDDGGVPAGLIAEEPAVILGDYVFVGSQAVELGAAAPVTSAVQQGNVLALTLKNSHAIWLLNTADAAQDHFDIGST